MTELLCVPLKKTSDPDLTKPLRNLISSTYSTADQPVDCTDTISSFQSLRNAATKIIDCGDNTFDNICRYI